MVAVLSVIYEASPEAYGTDDLNKMAAIDQQN